MTSYAVLLLSLSCSVVRSFFHFFILLKGLKLQLQDSSSPVYNGQLPLDKNREEQINKLQDDITHLKKKLAGMF